MGLAWDRTCSMITAAWFHNSYPYLPLQYFLKKCNAITYQMSSSDCSAVQTNLTCVLYVFYGKVNKWAIVFWCISICLLQGLKKGGNATSHTFIWNPFCFCYPTIKMLSCPLQRKMFSNNFIYVPELHFLALKCCFRLSFHQHAMVDSSIMLRPV